MAICDLSHHPEGLNLVERFPRKKYTGHHCDRGMCYDEIHWWESLDDSLEVSNSHLSFENGEGYD